MRIEGDLETMRIVGPSVSPFVARNVTVCPACGMEGDYLWRRILRRIRGKAVNTIVTMRYCPGDQPPTDAIENPFSFLMFGPSERVNKCSGIPMPHLHCRCDTCQAEWFSAVKQARDY